MVASDPSVMAKVVRPTVWTTLGELVEVVEVISVLDGVVVKADCLFRPEVVDFSPWHSQ